MECETSESGKLTLQLPREVVTHILNYVSLSDRIIAAQVCRLWREAALDPRLHLDTAWVIRDDLSRPAQTVCQGLSRTLYPPPTCLHLVLNDVEIKVSDVFSGYPSGTDSIDRNDFQSPEAQFWEQYGPSLRSLWLNCCEASERAFPILLRRCPRLRSLSVSSCREMLMSGRLLANEVESKADPDKSIILSDPSKCAVVNASKMKGKETKQKGGLRPSSRKPIKSKKIDKTDTKGCLAKSVKLERQNAVRNKSRICESSSVNESHETTEEFCDEWTNNSKSCKDNQTDFEVSGDLNAPLKRNHPDNCASKSLEENDNDLCLEDLGEPSDFRGSSSDLLEGPLILPELKELRLASNRYLSDALFERFVALSPELESLSLSGCHITFHQGIYRRFYPQRWEQYQERVAARVRAAPWIEFDPLDDIEPETDDEPISESVLTFQNVLRYFRRRKRQGGKLLRLSLGHTLVDNASLIELARDIPHGLRSLHLRACEQISSLPLPHVKDIVEKSHLLEGSLENQSNWWSCLTELDMSLCSRLTNTSLEEISVHMGPKLRSLALRRCGALTDAGVSTLHHCIVLEKIDISECCQVTATGVLAGICGHNIMDPQHKKSNKKPIDRASLRSLYAYELSSGAGGLQIVKEMVMNMPTGITHLDLGSWSTRVDGRKLSGLTDEVVAILVNRLKSLQVLKISGADGLTDAGLMGLIDLTEANSLNGSDDMTSIASDKSCFSVHPPTLGGIPHLSSNPHHISLMTRAEAEIVLRAKKSGEVCKRRGWMEEKWEKMMRENSDETSFSDEDINVMVTSYYPIPQNSVINLTGLQELDLSWCFSITDLSLKYAIRFRELRHLNLSHCLHISDVGLSHLSEYNPSLESLLLAFCSGISDAGVEYLVNGLPRLKHLDLQGCRELTDTSLHLIANNCKELRYLDVSGCLWMSLETAEETEQKLSPPLHSLHRRGLAPKIFHVDKQNLKSTYDFHL